MSIVNTIIFLTPVKLQSTQDEISVGLVETHTRFKPSLDAFIEETAASWIRSLVFRAIHRGMETATVAAR